MVAPIEQHHRWRHFLRALAATRQGRPLQSVTHSVATRTLAPATAIARFIQHFEPRLAEQEKLRLVVLGAELIDAIDNGRWYAPLPAMLGRDFQVEVTLVGKELGLHDLASPAAQMVRHWPEARLFKGDIVDFFAAVSPEAFDLAFLFQPGFQELHAEWFANDAIRRLLAAHVPVGCTSYVPKEFEWDRYIVEAYGFEASEREHNPLHASADELPEDAPARWGSEIWRFLDKVPPAAPLPDPKRMENLELYEAASAIGMGAGIFMYDKEGEVLQAGNDLGEQMDLIALTAGFYVDRASGDLYFSQSPSDPLVPLETLRIAPEDLEEYALLQRPVERDIWVGRIFMEQLLPKLGGERAGGGQPRRR